MCRRTFLYVLGMGLTADGCQAHSQHIQTVFRQGSNELDSSSATERSSPVMLSAAKHLCAQSDRCFAALSMTRGACSNGQGLFFTLEPCLSTYSQCSHWYLDSMAQRERHLA